MADQTLKEQLKEERKYYLGYVDKVPGTNKTVSEARKDYQKEVKKEADAEEKRRSARLKSKFGKSDPITQSSIVTHGVVRDLNLSPAVTENPPAKPKDTDTDKEPAK